ncbi:MAG: DegT/DnrJ/EryC1/StrS family aminotransferase [Crocinitomicaceae bacterium]
MERTLDLLQAYFGISKDQIFLFSAGRMAVYTLIKILNLGKDDEVIVAGYTCVVLTNAIKFTGCKIKYVDIENETFNIDLVKLKRAISPLTKILIVPHNFGITCEYIHEVKKEFPNLIIIEDAAHTFGSRTLNGELCGTLGDASFFSLEYSKPITAGLGGVLLINNKALLPEFKKQYQGLDTMKGSNVFKLICTLGIYNLMFFKKTNFFHLNGIRVLRKLKLVYRTSQKEIDGEIPDNYPTKLNPKLSCFLPYQLKNIEKINQTKREIIASYNDCFSKFKNINSVPGEENVLLRYPILFKDEVSLDIIEAIQNEGRSMGYNFGIWFNDVVHPKGSFRYGYNEGDCQVGEDVSNRIINLPVNVNIVLNRSEIENIAALFKKHGVR